MTRPLPGESYDEWRARQSRAAEWTFAAVLALGVLLWALVGGCGPGLADAYATMTVQERALMVAAKDLPGVCEQRQKACVDDADSKQTADDCRTREKNKCRAAAKIIEGNHDATVTAKDMVQGSTAAAKLPKVVMGWIGVAIRGYVDVTDMLAQLGYHLGGQ